MHKMSIATGLAVMLAVGVVFAQAIHIDMDQDLMQVIDDTTKDVNSNLALKDAKAAAADAQQLESYFKEVESIFVQHGQVEDGVDLAKQAQQAAIDLEKSVATDDFDAAQTHVRALTRTCKSCHDVYKST